MRRCKDEKMWWEDEKMWRWEDVMRRCKDEKMWWEDVMVRRWKDVKMRRWEDVKMRRCEDEKMRRCEDEKMRRCQDEKMWRWEDVNMRRWEYVNMRRLKYVKMRRWEDVNMRRCEDVKMRSCEDQKMRRWEDVKMRRCDEKMRRCEDEKMWWEDVMTDLHYFFLKKPSLRRSREKKMNIQVACLFSFPSSSFSSFPPLKNWSSKRSPTWRSPDEKGTLKVHHRSSSNHRMISWLVVGPPLWKIWKSIGMMKFPIHGKITLMFQTTNQ